MTSLKEEDWFNEKRLQKVLALLNGDGGETRIVGGAVRNALMGMAVSDIDMATTLTPDEVTRRVNEAGLKAVPTGIEHGTVTVVCDKKPFEVTTLRRDVETFGRHATVQFGTDWAEDAARRDLTINALYAGQDGEVVDLVDGLQDIDTKTVRFIGEAATRIEEDYLRILRFFRFFAWYGGGRPDADGLRASTRLRDGLKTLSAERIWAETRKLLSADDPSRALLWMRQTGVLTIILPETEKWGIDAVPGLIAAERALSWQPDVFLRLAAMVPPDQQRLGEMAKRLKMANAERDQMLAFAGVPAIAPETTGAELRRMLYWKGREGVLMRLRLDLAAARARAESGDLKSAAASASLAQLEEIAVSWSKPVFPIKGSDAIAAGLKPGPRVGAVLSKLEAWWVEREFQAERNALLGKLDEIVRSEA